MNLFKMVKEPIDLVLKTVLLLYKLNNYDG